MSQLLAYQKRLSGPLLDRIDLSISVTYLPENVFLPQDNSTDLLSETWRTRVSAARDRQHKRNKKISD